MNPVPRPMVYVAGVALAGVCVLGLYLGMAPSFNRLADEDASEAASSAPTPAMAAAIQATPLKTETPPPSAAPPASSAPALKPKPKDTAADQLSASDEVADNGQPGPSSREAAPPEPPPLYSPDEPPAPPPANESSGNTPPY